MSPKAFLDFARLHQEPMLLLSLDGVILAANPAAERFVGQGCLAGRSLSGLTADGEEEVCGILSRFADSSSPLPEVMWISAADGPRAVSASGARVSDGDGPPGLCVRLQPDADAPERLRRLREQLRAAERELGEQAQKFARERELRREAERATELKDEFLATVAHELRSPLNGIVIWSQLLRESSDPDTVADGTASILRSAHQLSQLVDDLLDMSRIVTGNLRLELGPVDLGPVVRDAWEVVRFKAREKDIRLEHRIDPDARLVWGDPDRLQQVVWNLLSNAIKFSPRDTAIELFTERVGSVAHLVVRDQGEGIAAEDLPYVFDRFRQACDGSRRNRTGLGLGLAIVRHIAELHQGTASAHSKGRGHGATFTIELPVSVLESAHRDLDGFREVEAHAENADEQALAGARVLLVEDHAEARAVLSNLLRKAGASVHAAASVDEALQALDEHTFDVLVSDIAMPDRSGYELARELRKHARQSVRDLPAVAVTAHNSIRERRLALKAGFQSHVVKPLDPRELLRVLASLRRQS